MSIPRALATQPIRLDQKAGSVVGANGNASKTQFKSHLNPEKKQSTKILRVMNLWREAYPGYCDIKKSLVAGENPDQQDTDGTTPLIRAILGVFNNHDKKGNCVTFFSGIHTQSLEQYNDSLDSRLIKLLLRYGANPHKKIHITRDQFTPAILHPFAGTNISAIELAEQLNPNALALMRTFVNTHKNSQKSPSIVTSTDFNSKKNSVTTSFNFSEKESIYTTLKCTHDLTALEKQTVFSLFSKHFVADEKSNLADIFNEDFGGDNKAIELIYSANDNRIIGFNLFEAIRSETNPDHLIIHWVYSLIEPQYRGCGIIPLLGFRLPFSLQQLAPEIKIGIFFCAASYNSYRMIKDTLHFPLHGTFKQDGLINNILEKTFNKRVDLYHSAMSCFFDEQTKVKDDISESKSDLAQHVFNHILINDDRTNPVFTPKSVPVFLYAGEENLATLAKTSEKFNIDFNDHINRFIPHLRNAFLNNDSFKHTSRLPFRTNLFWKTESNVRSTSAKKVESVRARL